MRRVRVFSSLSGCLIMSAAWSMSEALEQARSDLAAVALALLAFGLICAAVAEPSEG